MFRKFRSVMFLAAVAFACRHDPMRIDVSGIRVDLSPERFEKVLFTADPSALEDSIPNWKTEYGSFLDHFSQVLRLGPVEAPGYADRLSQFVTDRDNYLIYRRTMEVFPDLDTIAVQFTEAFRHYRHYFPGKPIPRIITYISGFNQSAITDDSLLAIGLDKYLGTRESLYSRIGVYKYLLVNMHPKKVVSDGITFWGETEFPFSDSVNNLIASMIYRGRLLYFTSAMIPDGPDTLNWGFSNKALEFCRDHERSMWTSLIENKFLFSTDQFTIDKFILEGPFTRDFGRNSPARAAVWIGYRIVRAYMEKNKGITLSGLMEEKDYMKILNRSAYDP